MLQHSNISSMTTEPPLMAAQSSERRLLLKTIHSNNPCRSSVREVGKILANSQFSMQHNNQGSQLKTRAYNIKRRRIRILNLLKAMCKLSPWQRLQIRTLLSIMGILQLHLNHNQCPISIYHTLSSLPSSTRTLFSHNKQCLPN